MAQIIFISGGQRSGKSSYAQQLAESLSISPMYLATSNEDEAEFINRVARHKKDRGEQWQLTEEAIQLDHVDMSAHDVVLLDCVTLWLSNIFNAEEFDLDSSFEKAKQIFSTLTLPSKSLIVVSNEIGLGLHPHDSVSRRFVDLQGWINQAIAKRSDKAIFMVSGLPLFLKGEL